MALVEQLRRAAKERVGLHQPVDCSATIFTAEGRKILQLDTYGSSERKIVGKVSQSLQFTEESARELVDLIQEAFPHCIATITFPLERQLEFPVSGAGGESPSDN